MRVVSVPISGTSHLIGTLAMGVVFLCGQIRNPLELKDAQFVVKLFPCELGKL